MDRDAVSRQRRRGSGAGGRRGLRRLRPTVMALEGRALPATLTVGNTDDGGAGSLRAAIAQANADGGGRHDRLLQPVRQSADDHPDRRPARADRATGTTTVKGPGAGLLSVSGNSAQRGGGGMFNFNGTATLSNAIVAGNSAPNGDVGGPTSGYTT